jgi:putative peptide zinc metalloprotease protein
VRAEADGFVLRLLAEDGTRVHRGDPLLETDDPLLRTRARLLAARVRELEARLAALRFLDRARADVTRKELAAAREALEVVRERLASLVIPSPANGRFVVPEAADLPGRFLRRGEVIGWVAEDAETVVRVVVGQDDIALVRERTRAVEVALADWNTTPVAATVIREVPAAFDELPNRALGASGGGPFAVDPRDPQGLRTLEKVFQLDLALPPEHAGRLVGRRVYVRFDHGYDALARQLYRAGRQLFLSRFAV